ncbi:MULTISPECIES: histone deacetylase family protein [Nostocales]|uniref:histone deacetylase n=3 Tax=Nostocales TaxID=1161 RepID=A0A0C1N1Q7_9CYAN|nr:histone deacetylase [Tolypothrix bouteillei]KAF3883762.1 histone deacetylase [Tolypothrix bouteillei VB521301]
MTKFAVYLHPHTCYTSKPSHTISWIGYSFPYYSQVRLELAKQLTNYPILPIRKAQLTDYLQVHKDIYLKNLVFKALSQHDKIDNSLPRNGGECEGLEYCLPSYLYSLGGLLEAIDRMKKGVLERAYCFSLPGHHAHTDWGHGYCLLNPLAAAAKYAQIQGFQKILIVDWDIHHGDGTQSIFVNDRNVYCISIHNGTDLYMAKASDLKAGTTTVGLAVGHCNIPLIPQNFAVEVLTKLGIDGKFYTSHESLNAFQEALLQIPWTPDLILIFSGYDSHQDDCGKGITDWTNQEFKLLTLKVLELAKESLIPVISTHGGGYKLPVTVSAALSHVEILASS